MGPAVFLPDHPALALQQAVCSPAFRIGGGDRVPVAGPVPVFETLSGGTMGDYKRIYRTQHSWICSFLVNARLFQLDVGYNVAILGHLVHSLALYGAMEALYLGGRLHCLMGLPPLRQRALLARNRVEVLYATPTQLRQLLRARGASWPHLRHILVGGAKLDGALRTALGQVTQAQIVEFYGAAETSFMTLAYDHSPAGSVGAPYPEVELKIMGGKIWARSPYLALGYAGHEAADVWQNGWACAGEEGYMDRGHLWITGRTGRMVKIAEQAVSLDQIEAGLMEMAGVHHAAAFAQPDALRGQQIMAVLCGLPAHEQAIMAQMRGRFGPLKAPRRLVWVDDWPLLPSGKTDYPALRRRLS